MPLSYHSDKGGIQQITSKAFSRKFLVFIILTWLGPAVIGMGFLLYINMFSVSQMWEIQTEPLEPLFVILSVSFTYWYFKRFVQPICRYLDNRDSTEPDQALQCMRSFPLHYWGLFLLYLLMAPIVVIYSAELYTDFVAQPVDWFRIHLVALIVSIIVGLPIFFMILDLFGQTLSNIKFSKPHVTIKTKVFLIGALTPLLIDTMLVQYYWTRTKYFTSETFVVWLTLEILAIAGSLIFVRSFGQSLSSLQTFMGLGGDDSKRNVAAIVPRSTDELGVLTADFRELLDDVHIKSEILELNLKLLRDTGGKSGVAEMADAIIDIIEKAIYGDIAFLILHDEQAQELVGVAQTGAPYKAGGHFRLSVHEVSMAVMVFNQADTCVINDVPNDPRCNPDMVSRFNVKSALAVPLRVEGKLIGVLMSSSSNKLHNYTRREVALLEGLAREAAIALHAQQLRMEREQVRQELSKTESMLHLVLDTIPSRVFWKDANSIYIGCNTLFAQDAGLKSPEQIVGKTDDDLMPKNQAENHREDDREVMRSGKPKLNYEERQTTPEGVIWLEKSKVPLTDADGKILGILGTYHDITDRKASEAELQKHREHLEELVQERTDELTVVNKELESFSYSVSHDLRAPLRSIDGFSQAVLDDYADLLDNDGRDFLQRIRSNAQIMSKLIDDMLELARVTRGELVREKIDLSLLARNIIDKLCQEDPDRNVEADISPNLFVNADPRLIEVVLDNLIRNAWKYSSKQPVASIQVGTSTSKGKTAFYVRDNGVGFDMQYADKLFGVFQRLHGKNEFEGTGVGLATVQRIIHRHGGHVWAEAEINKGATFYFTLGK